MFDEPTPEETKPIWPWLLGGCACLAAAGLLLLVVAAAVIPSLFDRRRTPVEPNGASMLRWYASAQSMYHRNDHDGNGVMEYANPYVKLYSDRDGAGEELQLIDAAFAAASSPGGTPKHGYLFQDMKTIGGEEIYWAVDFALCATPAVYGKTGRRTWIVKTEGTIWYKDLGRSQFVTDFPADPAAEGWTIGE